MKSALILSILLIGCGGSSTATRSLSTDSEAGAGGEVSASGGSVSETGGSVGETGGSVGETGGSGGSETGGSSGATVGGAGAGGEPAAGGTGNVGGSCEPWSLDNIAINLTGWTPESGDPIPQACGMIQDPCTEQWVDAGGCGELQICGGGTATYNIGVDMYFASEGTGIPNICADACTTTTTYGAAPTMCQDWADDNSNNLRRATVCTTTYFESRDYIEMTTNVDPVCEGGQYAVDGTWCCPTS